MGAGIGVVLGWVAGQIIAMALLRAPMERAALHRPCCWQLRFRSSSDGGLRRGRGEVGEPGPRRRCFRVRRGRRMEPIPDRYRTGDVKVTDLVTIIGAIGGAAVLKLFPAGTDLFGWYGLGLAAGFFLYFVVLLIMVARSNGDFTVTWFLDGRHKEPGKGWTTGGVAETTHPDLV